MENLKRFISDLHKNFCQRSWCSPLFLGHFDLKNTIRLLIYLNQAQYVTDLLIKFNMQHSSPCPTPIIVDTDLYKIEGEPLSNPSQHRSALGSLQYLTQTRPDISFAVNKLSQFLHNPHSVHWQAVKRLFRYLQGTKDYGIFIQASLVLQLQGFSNVDFPGSNTNRKSTWGYCVFFGNALVSWSSKKQQAISKSSTESEYIALANLAAELLWIRSLLQEIHFPLSSLILSVTL